MRALALASAATLLLLVHPEDAEAQAGRDLTVNVNTVGLNEIPTRTNVTLVVTVSNVRAGQATNVLTTVSVPAAFTSLSTTPGSGTGITCSSSGTPVGSTIPAVVSCTAPSLGGNSKKTFQISATAPSRLSNAGQFQNFTLTALVDPNNTVEEGPGGNINNSDNFEVRVVTKADLDVNLAGTPGQDLTTQVAPDLVYVVNVDNDGDLAASNVLVRSTLPKDVAFIRVEENTLGTCLQNSTAASGALNVNCTLTSLSAGANRHVRIIGKVLGGVADGVKVLFGANVDPNNSVPERKETDNVASIITTLRAKSDIQLLAAGNVSLTDSEGRSFVVGAPGDSRCGRYDVDVGLTVRNNGPFRSAATVVTTAWPAQITARPGACFANCAVPALNPGQSTGLTLSGHIDVIPPGLVQVTSVADPTQTLFDPVVGNNSVTRTVCGGVN